jgi:hypothetical protein
MSRASSANSAAARGRGVNFDTYGKDATHTPKDGGAVSRRVIIDRNVQRMGFEAAMVQRMTELSVLLSEGPLPRKGDTIKILETDETFTVDTQVDNDGSVARVAVRG